jgi:hypothetical protein
LLVVISEQNNDPFACAPHDTLIELLGHATPFVSGIAAPFVQLLTVDTDDRRNPCAAILERVIDQIL